MNEEMPTKMIAWISPRQEEPRRFWTCGVISKDCVHAKYILETEHEELLKNEYSRGYSDAESEIGETVLGEKVAFLSKRNAEQRELIEKLKSTLSEIAKPKVGSDLDWTEEEIYKWRAIWYRRYEDMARKALKDV